ncbi:hypothetical protein KJZ67_02970 [Patescibacteria group bacterium]|nr:hypothetical protein [Patescibacteria group bacterium]
MRLERPSFTNTQEAISDWKQSLLEEKQAYWRNMYQTGETNPYRKDREPVRWDAFRDASYELIMKPSEFAKHIGKHIRAIDTDFRGGVDIGDAKLRLQRVAAMGANLVPYFVFDVVTSIPSALLNEYAKKWIELNGDLDKKTLKTVKAFMDGGAKIIDVQNDKIVTAWGDIVASKRTGEKTYFTHEIWDKSADLGQTAMDDYLKDAINGPVLESLNRMLYQIPIGGALWEQLASRITALQEQSALSKGIAKSFYMGIGTAIGVYREVRSKKPNEKFSPSTRISQAIWKVVSPRMFAENPTA